VAELVEEHEDCREAKATPNRSGVIFGYSLVITRAISAANGRLKTIVFECGSK
jgi:hypothetical protein